MIRIVVDATNKAAITELGAATYPNVGYTHQGWLSEDQRTFYVDDELDESRGLVAKTRTLVIDVQRLDAPVLIGEFEGVTTAIDHNQYVRGAYSFQANYTAGVRIVDVSNPLALREAAFFDTFPANDAAQFDGIWNVYPYFASGNVVAGGIREGLFVIRPTKLALGTGPDEVPGRLGLRLTSANPARGAVRLELQLATAGAVRVAAYDALGREVARLADGERAAGVHPLTFDVAGLAQGLYFVRAATPDGAVTRAVTVLR